MAAVYSADCINSYGLTSEPVGLPNKDHDDNKNRTISGMQRGRREDGNEQSIDRR